MYCITSFLDFFPRPQAKEREANAISISIICTQCKSCNEKGCSLHTLRFYIEGLPSSCGPLHIIHFFILPFIHAIKKDLSLGRIIYLEIIEWRTMASLMLSTESSFIFF
jgi:hypothetical protein